MFLQFCFFRHPWRYKGPQSSGLKQELAILVTVALHRGAFCQFTFRWICYCGSNKSTGKETGKMHLCALCGASSFECPWPANPLQKHHPVDGQQQFYLMTHTPATRILLTNNCFPFHTWPERLLRSKSSK